MNLGTLLTVIALVIAIVSLFVNRYPLLAAAVIALAVALLVGAAPLTA